MLRAHTQRTIKPLAGDLVVSHRTTMVNTFWVMGFLVMEFDTDDLSKCCELEPDAVFFLPFELLVENILVVVDAQLRPVKADLFQWWFLFLFTLT